MVRGVRTHKDLLEELKAEAAAGGYGTVLALVVGFEATTEFIFAKDSEAEQKLVKAIKAGGEPVGIMGVQLNRAGVKTEFGTKSDSMTVMSRPLAEYDGEAWVKTYLAELAQTFHATLKASGFSK